MYMVRSWKHSVQEAVSSVYDSARIDVEEETKLGEDGENSEMSRVLIKGRRFIAKRRPTSEAARRIAAIQRWYEREVFFYQKLAPLLTSPPKCELASYSHSTGAFLLILEDLGERREVPEKMFGQLAVREMARIHNLPTKDVGPLPKTPVHVELAGLIEAYFRNAWTTVRTQYQLPKNVMDLLDRLVIDGVYADLCTRLATGDLTIVHGDYRPANLTVDPNGQLRVFDWQFVCLAKPSYDFAYFVGLAFDTDDRRAFEPDLRAAYVQERPVTAEFFVEDLQMSVLLALASFVMGAATASDHLLHHTSILRLANAAFDWNAVDILGPPSS